MSNIKLFEEKSVRSVYNEQEEKWYFSITDVVYILTDSVDALAYWRKLKQRLKAEGNETVTNCHALKMVAADGKNANDRCCRYRATFAFNPINSFT